MRRIIQSVYTFPLLIFRNLIGSRLDTFVGGLMFGAIFSLVVNVVTVKLQEGIQKQRTLEALEFEILNNGLTANNVIRENEKKVSDKEKPNYYASVTQYNDRIWNNSEVQKYTIELDPEVQGLVVAYYLNIIQSSNKILNRDEELRRDQLKDCYLDFESLPETAKEKCMQDYKDLLLGGVSMAEFVSEYTVKTLTDFHPTRDRLKSQWLKLLMGDKAVGALKIEPKPAQK